MCGSVVGDSIVLVDGFVGGCVCGCVDGQVGAWMG